MIEYELISGYLLGLSAEASQSERLVQRAYTSYN